THAEVGTGHRARTWNYLLNSHLSISNPVVLSMRATSRRTSPTRSRDAYADPFELFADGLTLMREEAQELARMGCTYIQVDAPDFGQLVDESQQRLWDAAGISFERVLTDGADMLNELASVPGV